MNQATALRKSAQIELVAVLAVLAVSAIFLAAFWRVGLDARRFKAGPAQAVVLLRESDAYDVWRGYGVKGRVLLHFGGHLPVQAIPDRLMAPSRESATGLAYARGDLRDDNYIYAALRTNFIRRVHAVIPANSWAMIKTRLRRNQRVTVAGSRMSMWLDGAPIKGAPISALPVIKEPVIVNFAADYFASRQSSPQQVFAALRRAQLKYDIVTFTPPAKSHPNYQEALEKIDYLKSLIRAYESRQE